MVLLYENSPEEVWELDRNNLQKRLYKITGLSILVVSSNKYGRIYLVHHQDARASSEIKYINGAFRSEGEFRAGMMLLHTQFNALVQGIDFDINDLGEIRRLV